MPTATYNVPEVSCDHCVQAITATVRPVEGVDSVEVSVDDKLVTVVGAFDDAAVRAAIDEAGYSTT